VEGRREGSSRGGGGGSTPRLVGGEREACGRRAWAEGLCVGADKVLTCLLFKSSNYFCHFCLEIFMKSIPMLILFFKKV
jgi:hypothetical protein